MLDALLERLGIKSVDELSKAELEVYQQWEKLLAGGPLTIDKLQKFFEHELARAEAESRKYDNSANKDLYLKAYRTFLSLGIGAISSPEKQRDALRESLRRVHKIDI